MLKNHETKTIVKNIDSIDSNLAIFQFGEEICAPDHSFGPAVRENFLFHYILSGEGSYYCHNEKFVLKPGEGFLIYPEDITFYKASKNNPWHYMWIEVGGLNFINEIEKIGFTKDNPIYQSSNTESHRKVTDIFRKIVWENNSNYSLLGLSYLLIDSLAENSINKKPIDYKDKSQEYIKQAVSFIKRRYNEAVTVEEIADYCNINRSYLGKLFKDHMALSTKEYLLNYRMKISLKFLKNSELPIKTVAYSVGFKDQLHFSHTFKKYYGKSPKTYREQNFKI